MPEHKLDIEKTYLGDSVYVDFDGYHVVLTTENGMEATNTIFMEPEVMQSLLQYWERLRAQVHKAGGTL